MNPVRLLSVLSFVTLISALPGCASADAGQGGEADPSAESALGANTGSRAQASDDAIKTKLTNLLQGVTFMSEADYPYTVVEADGGGAKRLSLKVLRTKLKGVVKVSTSSSRDIAKADCRAEKIALSDTIADASSTDPEEHDAKQAGLAVKYMTEQLKGVVGYTFGTNASGDQDQFGAVIYVYVGISRTSGKLIAILTEAVYT